MAMPAPGIATSYSLQGQPATFKGAVLLDGQNTVLGARRGITTGGTKQR